MTFAAQGRPAISLVDDDFHSARLMTRMLLAHGGPEVEHLPDAASAITELAARMNPADGPFFVIVDLKATSTATREFIAQLKQKAPQLLVIAMARTLDRAVRDDLIEAGAAAVFERHADLNLYRREAASIIAFWVRGQRLDAVGT